MKGRRTKGVWYSHRDIMSAYASLKVVPPKTRDAFRVAEDLGLPLGAVTLVMLLMGLIEEWEPADEMHWWEDRMDTIPWDGEWPSQEPEPEETR